MHGIVTFPCVDETVPTGPHGEKRPVNDVSNAVRVMEIATGIREEEYVDHRPKSDQRKTTDTGSRTPDQS